MLKIAVGQAWNRIGGTNSKLLEKWAGLPLLNGILSRKAGKERRRDPKNGNTYLLSG